MLHPLWADPFWLALAAKMALSAGIVVAASLAVERSGPLMGAMSATLPISAGPNYAFLAAEHGPAFIERSTLSSLAVNAATLVFILVYAALAQRESTLASLGPAVAVWLAGAMLAARVEWSLSGVVLLNLAAFAATLPLGPRYARAAPAPVRAARRWWELPARGATAAGLVAVVVLVGRVLGPSAAGVAALVPMALISLILVLHPRVGGPATAAMVAHALPGMAGFALGIAALHLGVVPFGAGAALGLALGVCVAWNLGLVALHRANTS